MDIKSIFKPRTTLPGSLPYDSKVADACIKGFMKTCEEKRLLPSPQKKLEFAKFLADIRKEVLPENYLVATFGADIAEKLTKALKFQSDKLANDDDRFDFRVDLKAGLMRHALGDSEGRALFFSIQGWKAPAEQIEILDNKIRALSPDNRRISSSPSLLQRHNAMLQASQQVELFALWPSSATHQGSALLRHHEQDQSEDSWAAIDARSSVSSIQDDELTEAQFTEPALNASSHMRTTTTASFLGHRPQDTMTLPMASALLGDSASLSGAGNGNEKG